jgi:hypothetical protein
MPLLLEDLAGDTADNLRRTADRFDAAANELAAREGGSDEVRPEVAEFARHAAGYAVAELPQAEAIWNWGKDRLLKQPAGEEADRLLRTLQIVFALQARLCVIARGVWKQAESLGCAPERLDDLDKAWRRFVQLSHRAKSDREYLTKGWQPKDPERFAEAMRRLEAGEMKFVTADEARKWFRPAPPSGEEG